MKSHLLQNLLIFLFTVINTVLLFLFFLQLPFGFDTFFYSLLHWSEMHPYIDIAAAIAIAATIITVVLRYRLGEESKSRLLYFRVRHAAPGHRAFFGDKEPGFDRKPLLKKFPEVRDSAWNPEVQFSVWTKLYKKYADAPLIKGTVIAWELLRDLFLISLVFLAVFLLTWPLNTGVPLPLAISYIFVFGAQTLFLMFSARGTGVRLQNNVLAQALGIKAGGGGKLGKKHSKK